MSDAAAYSDSDDLDGALPIPFRQDVLDAIVEAIRKAYSLVQDGHVEEEGFDGQTFGFNAYRVSWAQVERHVRELRGVRCSRPNHSLSVVVDGEVALGVYRGGDSLGWEIDSYDFDGGTPTRRRAVDRNQMRLDLVFPDGQDDVEEDELAEVAVGLQVVHVGNAEEACVAIYLGAPARAADGSARWVWRRRIYRSDLGDAGVDLGMPDTGPRSPYPRHADIEEPATPIELLEEGDRRRAIEQ